MIPEQFTTLIELLSYRGQDSPEKAALTWEGRPVGFGEMWQGINQFAAHLLTLGIQRGERVVIALPNSPAFFTAFYGVQRAGGVAVPVFPGGGPRRILAVAELCGSSRVIVPEEIPEKQLNQYQEIVEARGMSLVLVSDSDSASSDADFPKIKVDDIAFLQYTSGSTGNPKGVAITHDNLLTNIRQLIAGMEITADDVFISWLPVYHDMGLILMTMVPFYLGASVHLLSTNLRELRPWLAGIEEHRATFTAAPDFAYRLCIHRFEDRAYDLSSLRVALNAAEPVRSSTVKTFEKKFVLESVMTAGYGLAEATVGVSMSPPGEPIRVDQHGRVSVGPPFPGVEVAILSDDGERVPAGEVGEIAIRSMANTQGYFDNPAETEQLFREDGFLLSGDLGSLDEEGWLYFVSRKKNIIKRSGETIAPQELEEVVDGMPGVRYSAAVGIDRGGTEGEQVYLFAELREGDQLTTGELHEKAVEMVSVFFGYMGFRPARLYLMEPKSIPLTHNGKIRHMRLKELYLVGTLREQDSILYPEY
jgi:acyl-CoA synthetase (AMP-forming)/AMP-acid ligase II